MSIKAEICYKKIETKFTCRSRIKFIEGMLHEKAQVTRLK
jgi:hypothetical protein